MKSKIPPPMTIEQEIAMLEERLAKMKRSHKATYREVDMLETKIEHLKTLIPVPMTPVEKGFVESIVEARIDKIRELLIVKGKEYTRGSDRLHNFRRGAETMRTTMPHALHGYLLKHLVSYYDMLDDIAADKEISDKLIDEKIGDILVYFFLQEATIKQHKLDMLKLTTADYRKQALEIVTKFKTT